MPWRKDFCIFEAADTMPTMLTPPTQTLVERLSDGTTLEMMRLPGGTFLMGAPESEAGSHRNERPQRRVTVPPFCIGRTTVTIAQWCAIMGALPGGMKAVG